MNPNQPHLTTDELARLQAAISPNPSTPEAIREALAVRLMAVEGMRSGDVAALTWDAFRPEDEEEPAAVEFRGKAARETVPLSAGTLQLVEALRAQGGGPLFEGGRGRVLDWLYEHTERAGLPDVSGHEVRAAVRRADRAR
ncbi:hypothetical protein ACIPRL_07880 [Streptomyces sp. NPDC090085]|uniref:hypothetical protein n=1 Tax=Streptomyces sp. NPDC090085 TaxID=3365943 RepID=UPI0037F5BA5B